MSENTQPVFSIEKLYVKDLSVEVPGAPQIFLERETPQVNVQLRTEGQVVEEGVYEVTLTVTVNARIGEERNLFLVEVAQAGIFTVQGASPEALQPIVAMHCPAMLFPYARQAIASATMNAGFPPVHLQPINFEALYAQQLLQKSEAGAPAAA